MLRNNINSCTKWTKEISDNNVSCIFFEVKRKWKWFLIFVKNCWKGIWMLKILEHIIQRQRKKNSFSQKLYENYFRVQKLEWFWESLGQLWPLLWGRWKWSSTPLWNWPWYAPRGPIWATKSFVSYIIHFFLSHYSSILFSILLMTSKLENIEIHNDS